MAIQTFHRAVVAVDNQSGVEPSFAPNDIADLVAAFEAQGLSGLSNGAAVASYEDALGTTWTKTAGTATKETYRGLPVLHIEAGAIFEADVDFDASFDEDLTVVIVAWSDEPASGKIIVSDGGGILGPLALTESTTGSNNDRVSTWFGVQEGVVSSDARYSAGQVAAWRYDGANVRINRNQFEGPSVAKAGALALDGPVTIGAASSGFEGNIRAIYVFNRVITDGELDSLVAYACAQSPNFVDNNTYLFVGDSQTGSSGGTFSYFEAIRTLLNAAEVDYNYVFSSAGVGRVINDWIGLGETLFEEEVDNRISSPSTSEFETVIIWLGTNDLRSEGISAALASSRMDEMIAEFQARGATRFVLLGCLPIEDESPENEAKALEYNAYLESLDNSAGANTIKYLPIQEDADLAEWSSDFYGDSTHLNDAGKTIVTNLLLPALIPWDAEAPVNTVAPTVAPTTPSNGSTVTINHGTYTGYPSSFTYKWFADGVEIPGETGQSYEIDQADGVVITASEIGVNAYGSSAATVTSNSATVTPFAFLTDTGFEESGAPSGWSGTADFDNATDPISGSEHVEIEAGEYASFQSGGETTVRFHKCRIRIITNGGSTGYIFQTIDSGFSVSFGVFMSATGTLSLDLGTFTTDGMATDTDYDLWIWFNGTTVSVSFDVAGNPRPTSGNKFVSFAAAPDILISRWITSAGHEYYLDGAQVAVSSFA